MKKCPTCDRTFDDNMKFCQSDGTPLVDESGGAPLDPYATMVSAPVPKTEDMPKTEDVVLEPAVPAAEPAVPAEEASSAPANSAPAIAFPEETLLASPDPLKTMMVTEEEMRAAMGGAEDQTAPEPFAADELAPEPAPPAFIAPEPEPAAAEPELAPPPSPFTEADNQYESAPVQSEAATKIYQAEDVSAPAVETVAEPEPAAAPVFDEPAPATVVSPPPAFDPTPAAPMEQWTPPPAPDAQWQNQEIGSNTPFQPPPAGVAGQSQGLAIASMICGILSCLCCFSVLTGPAGAIMGLIARKKANTDPANYGGGGFAMVGIIAGLIGFLAGTAFYVLYFLGALASLAR